MKILRFVLTAIVIVIVLALILLAILGSQRQSPSEEVVAIGAAVEKHDDEVGSGDEYRIEIIDRGSHEHFGLPDWEGSNVYIISVNERAYTIRCYSPVQCEAYPHPLG